MAEGVSGRGVVVIAQYAVYCRGAKGLMEENQLRTTNVSGAMLKAGAEPGFFIKRA